MISFSVLGISSHSISLTPVMSEFFFISIEVNLDILILDLIFIMFVQSINVSSRVILSIIFLRKVQSSLRFLGYMNSFLSNMNRNSSFLVSHYQPHYCYHNDTHSHNSSNNYSNSLNSFLLRIRCSFFFLFLWIWLIDSWS